MCEVGLCQFPPSCAHELLILFCRRCQRDTHDGVIAVCWDKLAGLPAQAVGSLPRLYRTNTTSELLPEHDDTAICGPQVLQTMDGNGPLTDLGLVVAGLPLARF